MKTYHFVSHGVALFLLLASWVIALAGLASLQERCNSHDIFFFSNVTSMTPKTCSEFYSYQWWQIALEFFFWVYYVCVFALSDDAMKAQKSAIASLTGVLMVLYMFSVTLFYDMLVGDPQFLVNPNTQIAFLPTTNRENLKTTYHSYMSGNLRTRLEVTIAGFALVVFFHCVLIFIMSPFNTEKEEEREKEVSAKTPIGQA